MSLRVIAFYLLPNNLALSTNNQLDTHQRILDWTSPALLPVSVKAHNAHMSDSEV